MRNSTRVLLTTAVLSLVPCLASAESQTVDPEQLPKAECSSLRFSKDFLTKYPKAPAACLEARVYKGLTYMKVKGKVYVVDKPTLSIALMDAYGNTLGTVPVKNPKSLRVIIDGKETDVAHLHQNEDLTLWVPESMFSEQSTASRQ